MAEIEKYKRKDGKTYYRFNVHLGINPKTGKKTNTTKSGFKTKKEAKIALARIEQQVFEGTYFEDEKPISKYTFQEVFDKWEKIYKTTVRNSTYVKVTSIFNNQILPAFGHIKISELSTDDIQKQAIKWQKYAVGRSYINYTNKLLKYAVKTGIIDKNPMDGVTRPKPVKKKRKKDFYSKDELKVFLDGASEHYDPLVYPFLRLLAFTGLRKGEAIVLTWNDIDEENMIITVSKTLARGENGPYIEDTKTGEVRSVSIDKETLTALESIKVKNKNNFVFWTPYKKLINQAKPRKWLLDICKRNKLEPVPIHGLRHTHASLLFEAGASIKEVQTRLGHSNSKMTLDIYTHVTDQSRDAFAEKFSKFIDF